MACPAQTLVVLPSAGVARDLDPNMTHSQSTRPAQISASGWPWLEALTPAAHLPGQGLEGGVCLSLDLFGQAGAQASHILERGFQHPQLERQLHGLEAVGCRQAAAVRTQGVFWQTYGQSHRQSILPQHEARGTDHQRLSYALEQSKKAWSAERKGLHGCMVTARLHGCILNARLHGGVQDTRGAAFET